MGSRLYEALRGHCDAAEMHSRGPSAPGFPLLGPHECVLGIEVRRGYVGPTCRHLALLLLPRISSPSLPTLPCALRLPRRSASGPGKQSAAMRAAAGYRPAPPWAGAVCSGGPRGYWKTLYNNHNNKNINNNNNNNNIIIIIIVIVIVIVIIIMVIVLVAITIIIWLGGGSKSFADSASKTASARLGPDESRANPRASGNGSYLEVHG